MEQAADARQRGGADREQRVCGDGARHEPLHEREEERAGGGARAQPAQAARGGEAHVRVAVVQGLQERHLGERAAHVAEQGGVLGAAVGAGVGQAAAGAGDRAAGLEVVGDGVARLAGQRGRELGQDLGQRVLVAARGRARRLAVEQRVCERLEPLARLGVGALAVHRVHAPCPQQERVHHSDRDQGEGYFEGGRHA